MSGWTTITLNDLGRIVTGKTPPTSDPSNYGLSVPFVTPSDMDGRRDIDNVMRYLSPKGRDAVRNVEIPARSVLVSCIGSDMGKAALTCHPSVTNQQINSIVLSDHHDPLFVYYNLSARKAELRAMASGSAQPILNKSAFGRVKISVPSLPDQRAIGRVLGALDDKIALNRGMNHTLEAMAKAIFKDWFIDFGPTRAKMEGHAPYLTSDTWSLFPTVLNSEGVPTGWKRRQLGEFFRVERGLSYKGEFLTDIGSSMVNLGCFKGFGSFDIEKLKHYTGPYSPRHTVRKGDLLLANTDITQNRTVLGSPYVVRFHSDIDILFTHHVYAARPRNVEAGAWTTYAYYQLLRPEFRTRAEGFATGTTVLFLPSEAFEGYEIVCPDYALRDRFDGVLGEFWGAVERNQIENLTLTSMRDLLLPKLMSGEIRLKDAEKEVEAVI